MDILQLPSSLILQGREYAINADFRPCIYIMQIFERGDLSDHEKILCMVGILYKDAIPAPLLEDAAEQAVWFLNGGEENSNSSGGRSYGRLMSWKQDLRYILAAVDKVVGDSVRSRAYMHWWDFLSAYYEIGDCTFTTIVHQRKLRKTGKQTKQDKEWWAENKGIAELQTEEQLTPAEKAAIAEFYRLLEGGDA